MLWGDFVTNREIYEAALALIAEEQDLCEDYEARAGYLIGTFICECRDTDGYYRLSRGVGAVSNAAEAVDLDDIFPLSDRFYSAGAYFVAAMLVEVENPELCDHLFSHYAREISSIAQGMCGVSESIRNVYGEY